MIQETQGAIQAPRGGTSQKGDDPGGSLGQTWRPATVTVTEFDEGSRIKQNFYMCYRTRGLLNERDLTQLRDKLELAGNLRRHALQRGKDDAQKATREDRGGCRLRLGVSRYWSAELMVRKMSESQSQEGRGRARVFRHLCSVSLSI